MRIYFLLILFIHIFAPSSYGANEGQPLLVKNLKAPIVTLDEAILRKWCDEREEISILFTGDVMCHGTQLRSAHQKSSDTYDFAPVFSDISAYVKAQDYAVVNFETVTAGKEKRYRGYPTFNTPDTIVDALKDAGFDLLLTANNHCLDVGRYGLERTISVIQGRSLDQTGTFKEAQPKPWVKEIKGYRFAFINYTYGCNGMENAFDKQTMANMVNIIDESKILQDIQWAKKEADVILVALHWGNEYQRIPMPWQEEMAQKFLDAGADAVIGAHPHVIQPSKWKNNKDKNQFIIYSLGNLISNQRRETLQGFRNNVYTEDGLLLTLRFDALLWQRQIKLKGVDYEPLWVERTKRNDGQYDFRILQTKKYLENQGDLSPEDWKKIKQSHENTLSQMAKPHEE